MTDNNYHVTCDPKTGICTAKLAVSTRAAYVIPQERRGPAVQKRLAYRSEGKSAPAEYLGLGFTVEAKEINVTKRTVPFICSTPTVDRYGDVIKQDGWNLDFYKRNPVVLYGHDSHGLPIGKAQEVGYVKGNLYALMEFATAQQFPFADTVFQLIAGGFLNAVSVGFIPLEWEFIRGEADPDNGYQPIIGREYTKCELLENSVVTVPANPEALVIGRGYESVLVSLSVKSDQDEQTDRTAREKVFREFELGKRKDFENPKMSCNCGCGSKGACSGAQGAEARAVVPFHAYPLASSDTTWDASKEMGSTDKPADWKKMSTIVLGDGDKKGNFKLPHHKGPGAKFATVRRGVANALARVGQVKGASSSDKAGAKKHLAKHMAEFHKQDGKAFDEVAFLRQVELIEVFRDASPDEYRDAITVEFVRFILSPTGDSRVLSLADVYRQTKSVELFWQFSAEESKKFSNDKINKRLEKVHKSVMCAMSELGTCYEDAMGNLGQVRDSVQSVLTPGTGPDDGDDMQSETVASRLQEAHKSAKETHTESRRSMERFKTHMQKAIDNLAMVCDYVSPDDDETQDEDYDDPNGGPPNNSGDPSGQQHANEDADEETHPSADKILDAIGQELLATNGAKGASNGSTGAPPVERASDPKAATSHAETVDQNELIKALGELQK